jgi:hypothetical protein
MFPKLTTRTVTRHLISYSNVFQRTLSRHFCNLSQGGFLHAEYLGLGR